MNSTLQWLALSQLPYVGPVTIRHLLSQFKSIAELFKATPQDLLTLGLSQKQIQSFSQINWLSLEKDWEWAKKNNCHIISIQDEAYPSLLKEIHDPPISLFVQGSLTILNQVQLAIVGSRKPTPFGIDLAHFFAKKLSEAGLIITSGLALGIDKASHAGALEANGKTIAVLGSGLSRIYPRSNQSLASQIKNQGALISEFSPQTPPMAAHFPIRNRIISGLCIGILVVEAALKSGSLITARLGLEQNRDIFAIPGSIYHTTYRGCHELIKQGATLVECPNDVLEALGDKVKTIHPKNTTFNEVFLDLDPLLQRVFTHIGYEVTTINEVTSLSRLTSSEVSSMLLTLELKGYIRSVSGGYMRIIK